MAGVVEEYARINQHRREKQLIPLRVATILIANSLKKALSQKLMMKLLVNNGWLSKAGIRGELPEIPTDLSKNYIVLKTQIRENEWNDEGVLNFTLEGALQLLAVLPDWMKAHELKINSKTIV